MLKFFLAIALRFLEIGGQTLTVEIAATAEERDRGLMERSSLPENQGMLFVYERPQILSFWMKNTHIPLSIAFFDKHKKLLQIAHMNPSDQDPPPTYQSFFPAQYALEVNQGWFQKHGITPGMKFTLRDHPN